MNGRKNIMKQKGLVQKKKEKLSDLEEEAKERAQYLLQRANRMRMEQEDEVKELSEVGSQALCSLLPSPVTGPFCRAGQHCSR